MTGRAWTLAALGLALTAGAAEGGTMYRWTDERGVVHFADVPAANVQNYTALQFSIDPPARPAAAQPAVAPGAGAVAPARQSGAGAMPPAPATGPPRIVILDRDEVALGDTELSFSGKVENQGGSEAREVAIAIRVVEP